MKIRPTRHRHSGAAAIGAILVIGFCCYGCRPVDLLDEKVSARTPFHLMMWKAHIGKKQTSQEQQELEDMIQELSLSVMINKAASGSEGVDAAVRAEIDGVTLRELLLQGYRARQQRLDLEKTRLEVCIDANSLRRTRPGDAASVAYLRHYIGQQMARLETIDRDLQFTAERLAQLGDSTLSGPILIKVRIGKPRGAAQPDISQEEAEPMDELDEPPQLLSTGAGKLDARVSKLPTVDGSTNSSVFRGAPIGIRLNTTDKPGLLPVPPPPTQAAQTSGDRQETEGR
jgi:hypothetical protein